MVINAKDLLAAQLFTCETWVTSLLCISVKHHVVLVASLKSDVAFHYRSTTQGPRK